MRYMGKRLQCLRGYVHVRSYLDSGVSTVRPQARSEASGSYKL